jgi:hypothetical protein
MQTERIRQTLSGRLTQDQIEKFQAQGWNPVAIEWERVIPSTEQTGSKVPAVEDPPFGLRIGEDCLTLREDPEETEILATMMELIIQDGPYSSIAEELNRRGFVTRQGSKWSPVAVFEMLPRLIEAGPKILSAEEWHQRRQQSLRRRPGLPI